jgi:shikimate dehydrogenase
MDEVSYISGETRIFAIVGHPIEQVRSPEMITAEVALAD